jgi:hypothetical protein
MKKHTCVNKTTDVVNIITPESISQVDDIPLPSPEIAEGDEPTVDTATPKLSVPVETKIVQKIIIDETTPKVSEKKPWMAAIFEKYEHMIAKYTHRLSERTLGYSPISATDEIVANKLIVVIIGLGIENAVLAKRVAELEKVATQYYRTVKPIKKSSGNLHGISVYPHKQDANKVVFYEKTQMKDVFELELTVGLFTNEDLRTLCLTYTKYAETSIASFNIDLHIPKEMIRFTPSKGSMQVNRFVIRKDDSLHFESYTPSDTIKMYGGVNPVNYKK